MIHVFIKGQDDFGKEQINNREAVYSQHSPRSRVNDIHIYYYPRTASVGIYQVTKETQYYYKEGFSYIQGRMNNLIGRETPNDLIIRLKSSDKPNIVELGTKLEDIVYELAKKYNPEHVKH